MMIQINEHMTGRSCCGQHPSLPRTNRYPRRMGAWEVGHTRAWDNVRSQALAINYCIAHSFALSL